MDVDATSTGRSNTKEEFTRRMRGRCYGCGGNHVKRNCQRARNEMCIYCKRRGHFERVCQDKFMGLARNRGLTSGGGRQQIAASSYYNKENFSLFENDPNATVASTSPPAHSNPTTSGPSEQATLNAQLAQLNGLLSGLSAVVNKPQGF